MSEDKEVQGPKEYIDKQVASHSAKIYWVG
jgi:hypothetical protein